MISGLVISEIDGEKFCTSGQNSASSFITIIWIVGYIKRQFSKAATTKFNCNLTLNMINNTRTGHKKKTKNNTGFIHSHPITSCKFEYCGGIFEPLALLRGDHIMHWPFKKLKIFLGC